MINWHKYIILILSLAPVITLGQTKDIHIPFQCGFEANDDLSNWVLNPNTQSAHDQWVIGSSTHSEGKRSLYIIAENDTMSPRFGSSPNISVAYLRLKFPSSTKTEHYSISFDWKCQGVEETSMLYTMFVPYSQLMDPNSTCYLNKITSITSGLMPTAIKNQCKTMENGVQALLGSEKWENVTMSDVSINKTFSNLEWALLFIWVNNNKNEDVKKLSNFKLSMSKMTFPHQIARLNLIEQIYRAFKINNNEAYHR